MRSARHGAGRLWQRSRKEWHSTWRWGHNLAPTLRHLRHREALDPTCARAVADLRQIGFATGDLDDLAGSPGLFDELRTTVDAIEAEQAEQIAQARAALADGSDREKTFLYEPLGTVAKLDLASPFARVADRLAPLADAYLGMRTQVRAYAIWHNLASEHPPTDSQLWHRDREDLQMLKAFVYLDDVSSENGPFWYAPGTHALGTVRATAASARLRGVERTTDAQMAEVLPAEEWIEATGRAGSLVLADTHGYHKGGRAVAGDRRLLMVLYTSKDSGVREWFDRHGVTVPTDPTLRFRWSRG